MSPASKTTFNELTKWYLNLRSVKRLASFSRVEISLRNFNNVFDHKIINNIRPIELEDYQEEREEKQGLALGTIDLEMRHVKAVINKAFDNDMVSGRTLRMFKDLNQN